MKQDLLVVGAGGHAKVVIDAAQRSGVWNVVGALDDAPFKAGKHVLGVRVLGPVGEMARHRQAAWIVVGIGSNDARRRLQIQIAAAGIPLATVVHPAAVIAESASLGPGCVVMAGVVVNAGVVVGEGVILNTGSTIDHDCRIGSFAHIAPGVHLCGEVEVSEAALLGVGASAIPGVAIGRGAVVGAGSAVVRNVRDGATVAGVPAQEINQVKT